MRAPQRHVFNYLQIPETRERALVGSADAVLGFLAAVARLFGRRLDATPPARVLLLRLERIGDLVMVLDAISSLRARLPHAEIDLVVGSWNASLAGMVPGVNRVETLDAPWLARGEGGASWPALVARARQWRGREYDLIVNFEPDIRSNLLAWIGGGRRRAGYRSGGGGALLTDAIDYQPTRHVSMNARRLVAHAVSSMADPGVETTPTLSLPPAEARAAAAARLAPHAGRLRIGVHASGGRAVKQWPPESFRELASALIQNHRATVVLTGTTADRPLVDFVKSGLPEAFVLDAAGDIELPGLAALVQQLDLYITGDTGPMHLASAVGTPIVAIFGPSDPDRYAPRGLLDRVVRIDLPCAPCNRIRLPPERCIGHTPDCLAGVSVTSVLAAVDAVLQDRRRP